MVLYAVLLLLGPILAAATGDAAEPEGVACHVPQGYTDSQLLLLYNRSCSKVDMAEYELHVAEVPNWDERIQRAKDECAVARSYAVRAQARLAAHHGVNAWGTQMMNGSECCTLLHPPYCLETAFSTSTWAMLTLFGALVVMFGGAVLASCFLRIVRKEPQAPQDPEEEAMPLTASTVRRSVGGTASMGPELQNRWLQGSCLRVLPGADRFAASTASLFSALQDCFDFQGDNVRNQFDHLLSLWRSHCSMVADRSIEEGVQVDESALLREALEELHAELLEGFLNWRRKFKDCMDTQMGESGAGLPPLGGAEWEPLPSGLCGASEAGAAESSQHLAEIGAYLLVWGEAGNVRFMPEVIYFLTELVLAAQDPGAGGLYSAPSGLHVGDRHRSGLFLARIIRPIYNVVFDEWYEYVDIDEKSKKDKKKLHSGYDRFLPPDVANYDDWDEFFYDPQRLSEGLLLEDGQRLFEKPHRMRFTALPRVDWAVSMDRFETKTHREVHSLWGVWASSHRVWLTHLVLFLLGLCATAGNPPQNPGQSGAPLLGSRAPVRFAAVGLVVPLHAFLWGFGRHEISGRGLLCRTRGWCLHTLFYVALWSLPILTYAAVRYAETVDDLKFYNFKCMDLLLVVHFVVSVAGLTTQLLVPSGRPDRLWQLTKVQLHERFVRYFFWFVVLGVKFLVGLTILSSMFESMDRLDIVMLGQHTPQEIMTMYYSTNVVASVLEWLWLWCTTFFLFLADTQLWFVLGCTFLGVATVLVQRSCKVFDFASEDAIAKIPERFSTKILPYSHAGHGEKGHFSPYFPALWDRIIEYMRYEDKFDNQALGDLSFHNTTSQGAITYQQLGMPLHLQRRQGRGTSSSHEDPDRLTRETSGERRIKVPEIFRRKTAFERGFMHYCGIREQTWPSNPETQWRLIALSRGLGLPMPRPFRAPYVPGLTVLIPHYGESIIMERSELYSGAEEEEGRVPLMDWLQTQYEDEFRAFTSRMQASTSADWNVASSQWEEYMDHQWEKICSWSSMRMQTLWRTVAGLSLYHPALQAHFEAQADRTASLAREGVWKPSDVFTCLVSMQMYSYFNSVQLKQVNKLFEKFPDSLQVAFIDYSNKGLHAEADNVHSRQRRRYFSCLIDRNCACRPDGRREPRFRIELPGYPILGDGKGDNQNHAIPFMRGNFAQCIDSNQGAYFEQMLMLPCVLGEFRTKRDERHSQQIIGLPEHITSDIGSIGDFAAGSEMAFGTILQRSYSVLGARMHYGHPDIMNKQFMMQQGGVSKATKTLNLSEDIFAGMDFTLRGEGRRIRHREYFHLAKGRDLGFNSVLVFFSKLSSGAGEQILTRQMFRLGQVLHLPECLSFYYAHVGYYITQFFVSWSMPLVVFTWLLVLTSGCEEKMPFQAFQDCRSNAAEVMGKMLSVWYSWVLFFFLIATSLPLFAEVWMERTFGSAVIRMLKQYGTGSFLHFIFQAKIIGYYVMNELRYGGATYMPTGRGLPTERRPFIGQVASGRRATMEKVGGLYLDYAMHTYYDGMNLLVGAVLVVCAGGVRNAGPYSGVGLIFTWVSIGLTIISWLLAPFIFNPYQFSLRYFKKDLRAWFSFFFSEHGKHWIEWYNRQQLQPRAGFRHTVIDFNFCLVYFFVAVWFANMNQKLVVFTKIYASYWYIEELHLMTLIPPVGSALVFCALITLAEVVGGCSSKVAGFLRRRRRRAKAAERRQLDQESVSTDESSEASDSEELADEEPGDFQRAGVDHTVVPESESDEESDLDVLACCRGIPLVVSSLIVTILHLAEAVAPLYVLTVHGFYKAFIAGLVLKLMLFNIVVTLMEGVLRSRCFGKIGRLGQPLDLWVHATRLFRDFLTSLVLLCVLTPFVLLHSLNEYACSGCSVHQLLIYRHPGHLARKEYTIDDLLARDSDSPTEDTEESSRFLRRAEEGGTAAVPGPVPPPPPLVSMPPTYSATTAPLTSPRPLAPAPAVRTA